jgi:hypothetical protein
VLKPGGGPRKAATEVSTAIRLDADILVWFKAHAHFVVTVYTGKGHKTGGLDHRLEALAGTTIKAEKRYLALAEISHVSVQF